MPNKTPPQTKDKPKTAAAQVLERLRKEIKMGHKPKRRKPKA